MHDAASNQTLDPALFARIADLAYEESGINLVPEKRLMVQSRLRHRLRALQLPGFDDYAALVTSRDGASERRHMISALTTNVTHFYREPHHFALLTEHVLPVMRNKIRQGAPIRLWSAGCSNGQEPYSIVMHLFLEEPALRHADFKLLATDIDPKVIEHARAALYTTAQSKPLPDEAAQFLLPGERDGQIRISPDIRERVTFKELNLLSDWPMRGQFDAIFCRNVVIYFDVETQERLWPRFASALAPHGLFFLGHSERIVDPALYKLNCIGPTTYAHTAHANQQHSSD
ncbi:MAG: protein-glutamate O-methyltransferase [Pseudomonadota bacterium]